MNGIDPLFFVKKKGKTRGRPSNVEKILSAVLDYQMKKPENQKKLKEQLRNEMIYGFQPIEYRVPGGCFEDDPKTILETWRKKQEGGK